jgi:hypothetical protein
MLSLQSLHRIFAIRKLEGPSAGIGVQMFFKKRLLNYSAGFNNASEVGGILGVS